MSALPTGTVTFLFTDIEGSTKLWEQHPEEMRIALARHDVLVRQVIEAHNGYVFKTVGDAFYTVFQAALDALAAAVQAHLLLLQEPWGELGTFRVRMGLHTGTAEERDGDYFGQTLNRVARLQGVGHGQQTLLSQATYQLVCDALPLGLLLQDMGQHRLKDLLAPEQIWQCLHPALPSEFPPLKSLDYLPTNLPRQMTSFIGREREMAEVKWLLPSTPLLTLVGTGGAGKTRLALQVGADILDNYKEGVWLVELAALSDPALVPQTVASALGIREEVGHPLLQTIQDHLRNRELLLLLDNCEHLLNACASLANALLTTCPRLTILSTSREPLGISGERSWRIPSLLIPEPDDLPGAEKDTTTLLMEYDACRLFVDRAVVHRQDFVLTRSNVPVVARLCHQLDGIPLAIELAAARTRTLSVEEINNKLDNRFRLLTGGSRAALPRQQTLRALIDWSYDLLNLQERTLLSRLSVFAGGWTLAAAEQICSGDSKDGEGIEDWEMLDLLTSLADKSLVIAQTEGEATRYRLLETVRQYARDRLAEIGKSLLLRARHTDYFLMLAEEIKPQLRGAEQLKWLGILEEEHDNLRQAITLCVENAEADTTAGEKGLRLGAALQAFWMIRGHLREGREWFSLLLAHSGGRGPTQSRAEALNGAGSLARMQGDYAQTASLYKESLAIFRELGDKKGIAASLSNQGVVAYEQSDNAQARLLLEESLTIRRELRDKSGIANSLHNLGLVATGQGDYSQARILLEEGLSVFRDLGDKRGIANSLNNLGVVAKHQNNSAQAGHFYAESLTIRRELADQWGIAAALHNLGTVAKDQGDYARACVFLEESLAIAQELGDKSGIANSLLNLGLVACDQGDYSQARVLYKQSMGIFHELGDRMFIAYLLEVFALLAKKEAQNERSVRIWGAAAILREDINSPLPPHDYAEQEREITAMQETVGQSAFDATWEEGRAMNWEQAVAYALEAN